MPEVILSVEDPPLRQDVAKMSGVEVMQFLKEKKLLETDLGFLTLSYEDPKNVAQLSFAFHEDETVLLVFEDSDEKKWAIHGAERSDTVAIGDESMARLSNFVDADTAAKAVDEFVKSGERHSKLSWETWSPIADEAGPDSFDEEEEEFTAKDKDFLQGLGFEEEEFDDDDW